jgi:hypothetical protein
MRRAGIVLAGLAVSAVGAFVEELVRPRRARRPHGSGYVAPVPAGSGQRGRSRRGSQIDTPVVE